jgi:hypothetical protein
MGVPPGNLLKKVLIFEPSASMTCVIWLHWLELQEPFWTMRLRYRLKSEVDLYLVLYNLVE